MNRYGRQAMAHWARWRPRQLAQIQDPEVFFADLGEQVAEHVSAVAAGIAGPDIPGEGYLGKLGRLRMAQFTAEEQVLRELVLLPPEPGHPEADEEDLVSGPSWESQWLPLTVSPGDPAWTLLGLDRAAEDQAEEIAWQDAQDRATGALAPAPTPAATAT